MKPGSEVSLFSQVQRAEEIQAVSGVKVRVPEVNQRLPIPQQKGAPEGPNSLPLCWPPEILGCADRTLGSHLTSSFR